MPMELITMLGSALLGGIMKVWGMKMEESKMRHEMLLEKASKQMKGFKEAREHKSAGFEWTRRVIALSAVAAIIVMPKLAIMFGWTDAPVVFGWTEWQSGFWFFTEGKEVVTWEAVEGIVITPLDTHLVSAIIGLYFGGSLIGHGTNKTR